MFAICAEAIIYLVLYNLHDCTFKFSLLMSIDAYYIAKLNIASFYKAL